MTTNLLIGYVQVPFNATSVTPTNSYASSRPYTNLIAGSRKDFGELATTTTGTTTIDYDLGASATDTVDYIALIRANLLKSADVTNITLRGSNGAPATITTFDISATTISDGNGQDYIKTFTESIAYRHFLFDLASTLSSKRPLSKVYIGKGFDLGRDPEYGLQIVGQSGGGGSRFTNFVYKLTYKGITDSIRQSFETKIGKYAHVHPIILFIKTSDDVLLNRQMLYCKITSYEFTSKHAGLSNLSIEVEELT